MFGTTGQPVRAAFHRPAALWLLPARIAQTRVGASNTHGMDTRETGILSLRDCGKHRFRSALGGL
jgi:hypothetical protein